MDDLFTDTPSDTIVEEFPFVSEPESIPTPEPTAEPIVTPEPIPSETPTPEAPSDSADEEGVAGSEEVAPGVTVVQVNYEELLAEIRLQNEHLEVIMQEIKVMNQRLTNIQNVMPAISFILGAIVGILLLKVLVSYFRP